MFSKLFRAGAKPASDDLRAAIGAIDVNALQRALADAESAYKESLILGEDADVERAEAARNRARLEIERAHARREELERRLADAEHSERKAAAESRVADVVARRDALVKRTHKDIARAHAILAPLLDDLMALDAELEPMNRDLDSGREQELAEAMGGYIVPPVQEIWGKFFMKTPLAAQALALPPTKTTPALGWWTRAEIWQPDQLGG